MPNAIRAPLLALLLCCGAPALDARAETPNAPVSPELPDDLTPIDVSTLRELAAELEAEEAIERAEAEERAQARIAPAIAAAVGVAGLLSFAVARVRERR